MGAQASYPFNRATRLELGGDLHWATFERETSAFLHAQNGTLLTESHARTRPLGSLLLVQPSIAIVHDTTVPGATGPLLGRRFRFELAPSLGNLRLTTVLADWRQYVTLARPFTLAVRLKQIGRLGSGATDPRLLPLVYSLRDVARGYSARSIRAAECGGSRTGCTPFHVSQIRHVSSANIELRVPLVELISGRRSVAFPVETFTFADNVALGRADGAAHRLPPTWLSSVGAGVRVNARGFVFEVAGTRPLTRLNSGWRLTFDFGPAF